VLHPIVTKFSAAILGNGMTFENILIIDEDSSLCKSVEQHLRKLRFAVSTATTLCQAATLMEREQFDLLFLGLRSREENPRQWLEQINARPKRPLVVMLCTPENAEMGIRSLRAGAFDCLAVPPAPEEIDAIVRRAEACGRSVQLHRYLEQELCDESEIAGDSDAARRLRAAVDTHASTDSTVLLVGECPADTARIARALHRTGVRAQMPFVRLNCAEWNEESSQHELFGGEGKHRAIGRLELAQNGTLLLESVGHMPQQTQVRLLHAIEKGEFTRGECGRPVKVTARIVATSRRDPADAVARGAFRQALLAALSTASVHVPPLRERACDIPALASTWLRRYARRNGLHGEVLLSGDAIQRLMAYSWPGNIRELENALERAVISTGAHSCIEAGAFDFLQPNRGTAETRTQEATVSGTANEPLLTLDELEKRQVFRALEFTKQNRTRAASLLKISVRTLRNKLHRYRAEGAMELGIGQVTQGAAPAPTGAAAEFRRMEGSV